MYGYGWVKDFRDYGKVVYIMGFDQRETNAVLRVLESGILSNYQGNWSDNFYGGTEIRALEKEWAEYFGVKHAIACNSATSGLWMALNATLGSNVYDRADCSWGNGIEYTRPDVIVSPYTMTCSASLPLLFGANTVFADIEPDYFCIDPDDIERKITPYTEAIIAVDIFGQPCDFDRINEIAERRGKEYGHKIYVIEDTAQAPGAKYKGKYAGTLGDIGVFSLNRHKHIHCGEGGICVTDDDELAFKLRLSMNHSEAVINDISRKELDNDLPHSFYENSIGMVGMNLRMTELSATIAREQLKKLDGLLEKYKKDAEMFPVEIRPECEHSFYRYAWLGEAPEWMNLVHDKCEFVHKKGYIKPIFQMPLFRNLGYDQNQCPVVQKVNDEITLAWRRESY